MIHSIIQNSQLEGANRLDAEYYQPEYLESMNTLNKVSSRRLLELALVTDGNHLSIAEEFVESGVRYLRGKDLQDFYISNDDPIFIPEKAYQGLKRSYIYKEDVLVSIVGTVGMVSIVADDFNKLTGSCKIAILHTKKVDPWFLAAFLVSKYGQNQIQRKVAGAVQTGIILKDLSNVLIPILSSGQQERIKEILEQAYKQQLQSEALYSQAENLLLKELGLKNFKIEDDLSFVVNFSDVKSANRIDADYFQPKYLQIIKTIKNRKDGWDTLENLTSLIGHPSNPPYENNSSENKTFIITQKHLADYFPTDNFWGDSEALYTTDEFIKNNAIYLLKENDIILYSVGAYIGKANIYNSNTKATIGSFLTLIRPRQELINPFCLLVFLNSPVGQLLTRRNSRGLAQQYIYPYDTKTIPIPKLDDDVQREIEKLIKKGLEARKKSKELLEEAKRKVEEMIEKGGE